MELIIGIGGIITVDRLAAFRGVRKWYRHSRA
jgi:hypothetical protein